MKGWVLFRILGALLLVLGVVLTLGGCRVWDNPADPDGVNYQGYHTVESADEVQAHTPTDGGSLVFQRFIISEARGAEAYHLQIASSVDFGNALYDGNSHAANIMLTDAPLSLNTDYYWRGRAKQDGQWGKWTDGWKFTMTTIGGLSPADGSTTTDTTPTFRWNAVLGAAGYELRIADSPAGLNSAPLISETDPSHTPASALTNLQTHYWQVRAKDGDGQFGFWSNVHSLEVEWGAVSGLDPADGSTTEVATPTLNWNAVSGAAGYELQLAESRAGVEASPIQSVTGASYTPASVLTNEQTYYWRVRAVDGDGEYGAWSGIASLWVENVLVSTSIAYWSFDGNTDDTQETGNAKAFNDYSYTNGVKNQAIYLTGSGHSGLNGGHVILPFIDLSRMDEFSISLWVKQDGNTSYLNHSESFITFGATGDGERIEIGYSPESGNVFFQGGIVYPLGVNGVKEWNHYTLVYNNDTVHGYINGKLIDTALYPISTMKEYSGIGCHWWSGATANSNRFIGAIDEVMIFNYALEEEEIDKLQKLQY